MEEKIDFDRHQQVNGRLAIWAGVAQQAAKTALASLTNYVREAAKDKDRPPRVHSSENLVNPLGHYSSENIKTLHSEDTV
jgi:hypothetical protein